MGRVGGPVTCGLGRLGPAGSFSEKKCLGGGGFRGGFFSTDISNDGSLPATLQAQELPGSLKSELLSSCTCKIYTRQSHATVNAVLPRCGHHRCRL